jgi:Lrp/AsnC family leucine-responsive transcriptional regulator
MNMNSEKLLDGIGVRILTTLQENARISYSALGKAVGLSSPAVADRVHHLEEAGYIKEYRAIINQERLGYPITAFINIVIEGGRIKDAAEIIRKIPEVVEAYHISGEYGFMLKVVIASMQHLESIINIINDWGETATSIVLSSPITARAYTQFIPKTPDILG